MNELTTKEQTAPAPINLGQAFDLTRPMPDRADAILWLLETAAELMVQRDEHDNPDAYADETFRQQEVKRRTMRGVQDLRLIASVLELRWVMENGNEETWIDADGQETSLLETIESQMPDEEQRASSGRARQVWSFKDTAQAFREAGFSDQRIAECNKSGLSSALGIVAAAQRQLAKAAPEDLPERYDRLIQAASETTTLGGLREKIKSIIDPGYVPPPSIRFSAENDGEGHCWFVSYQTNDQLEEILFHRLDGVLEHDNQLPEYFYRYWGQFINVPVGQKTGAMSE
jgi:hypothetical protein